MQSLFNLFPVPGAPTGGGASTVLAFGINDAGQQIVEAGGNYGLLQNGHTTPIVVPFPEPAIGALNNFGAVAGVSTGAHQQSIFFGKDGKFSSVADPYAGNAEVTGVNDLGQVIGYNLTFNRNFGIGAETGWIETRGHFTTIPIPGEDLVKPGGINDLGQVVGGLYSGPDEGRSWIYNHGVTTMLPFQNALATGINNFGEIVGTQSLEGNAFAEFDGHIAYFRPPALGDLYVTGVNDFGQIAGDYGNFGTMITLTTNFIAEPNAAGILSLIGLDQKAFGLTAELKFLTGE